MLDWKDLTVVLCTALVVLGSVSLAVSAKSFTLVQGKVIQKGLSVLNIEGTPRLANTIAVQIENDDRVLQIKQGAIVRYPVSEHDIQEIQLGSEVSMFVSAYTPVVRVIRVD